MHRSISGIAKELEPLSDKGVSQGSVTVPRICPVRICHIREDRDRSASRNEDCA